MDIDWGRKDRGVVSYLIVMEKDFFNVTKICSHIVKKGKIFNFRVANFYMGCSRDITTEYRK